MGLYCFAVTKMRTSAGYTKVTRKGLWRYQPGWLCRNGFENNLEDILPRFSREMWSVWDCHNWLGNNSAGTPAIVAQKTQSTHVFVLCGLNNFRREWWLVTLWIKQVRTACWDTTNSLLPLGNAAPMFILLASNPMTLVQRETNAAFKNPIKRVV